MASELSPSCEHVIGFHPQLSISFQAVPGSAEWGRRSEARVLFIICHQGPGGHIKWPTGAILSVSRDFNVLGQQQQQAPHSVVHFCCRATFAQFASSASTFLLKSLAVLSCIESKHFLNIIIETYLMKQPCAAMLGLPATLIFLV